MASEDSGDRRERFMLAGDGLLVTSAVFSVFTGIALVAFVILGDGGPNGPGQELAAAITSLVLGFAGMVIGPAAAWLLHGRRVGAAAVFGALVGAAASGLLTGLSLPILGSAFTMAATALGGTEITGALVLLGLVGLLFAAVVLWVLVDALRDLAPSRRAHVRLDVVRLVCLVVLVAFGILVAYGATRPGQAEMAEASIFALGAGLLGAGTMFGADLGERILKRGKYAPAEPSAPEPGPAGPPA